MTKVLSNLMLELYNVRMEPSNVRKKINGTTKCEKKKVTCDIGTTQYEDEIIKCEKKKVKEQPNVRKELSYVMLESHNVRMKPSNVRKKVRESSNVRKKLSHVML